MQDLTPVRVYNEFAQRTKSYFPPAVQTLIRRNPDLDVAFSESNPTYHRTDSSLRNSTRVSKQSIHSQSQSTAYRSPTLQTEMRPSLYSPQNTSFYPNPTARNAKKLLQSKGRIEPLLSINENKLGLSDTNNNDINSKIMSLSTPRTARGGGGGGGAVPTLYGTPRPSLVLTAI